MLPRRSTSRAFYVFSLLRSAGSLRMQGLQSRIGRECRGEPVGKQKGVKPLEKGIVGKASVQG